MLLVDEVTEEDLFTDKRYIGVHHPCHFLGMEPYTNYPGAFETNKKSLAAVTREDDTNILARVSLGGKLPYVLGMIKELARRTTDDETRDMIALWHDESHLNKFFSEQKKYVHTLEPQFAYPEIFSEYCEFEPKIVHLAKENSKYHV